jgi:hypothetical protein
MSQSIDKKVENKSRPKKISVEFEGMIINIEGDNIIPSLEPLPIGENYYKSLLAKLREVGYKENDSFDFTLTAKYKETLKK